MRVDLLRLRRTDNRPGYVVLGDFHNRPKVGATLDSGRALPIAKAIKLAPARD